MKKTATIRSGRSHDLRFNLKGKAGTDAIHSKPVYSYAVCRLQTEYSLEGIGLAFTLGTGNQLVCEAIDYLVNYVRGKEINELMARFGFVYRQMADDPNLRWLGPHKGVVHLALAAVVNACFDLWAKSKGVPLWKLLTELSPEALISTLDFSYFEDVLPSHEAMNMLKAEHCHRTKRESILENGYPGYDTSFGWFNYSDHEIRENVKKAMDQGFTALKLKVGAGDPERDIRRACLVRDIAGDQATLMFDANQQWTLPDAIAICRRLKELDPHWIEEPTHPDDVQAHVELVRETGVKLAMGEHIPNKVLFKNFLQSGSMSFNQVDVVRVGGVSEFILISLLSKKCGIPVVPHVGDMGQIHQHLVLFNHLAVGHPVLLLEHIPHLKEYFRFPATIRDARYVTPQEPGASSDLLSYE